MAEDTNLARLLLDRFRWFEKALLAVLADRLGVKLTSAQSMLFAGLREEGTRQVDLARELGITRQAVHEVVRSLEMRGLVEVVPDPDSARSKLVVVTAKGRESIDAALETFVELEAALRHRIGDESVDQLRNALEDDWGDPPGSI